MALPTQSKISSLGRAILACSLASCIAAPSIIAVPQKSGTKLSYRDLVDADVTIDGDVSLSEDSSASVSVDGTVSEPDSEVISSIGDEISPLPSPDPLPIGPTVPVIIEDPNNPTLPVGPTVPVIIENPPEVPTDPNSAVEEVTALSSTDVPLPVEDGLPVGTTVPVIVEDQPVLPSTTNIVNEIPDITPTTDNTDMPSIDWNLNEQDKIELIKRNIQQGRMALLTARGGTLYLTIYAPDVAECKILKLAGTFENLSVDRATLLSAAGNFKIDKKYVRTSMISTFLASVLTAKEQYPGTPLIDEYRQGLPMWWRFENVAQLRQVIQYFKTAFADLHLLPMNRPTLLVTTDDMLGLAMLTDDELAFLDTYFLPGGLDDELVKNFFYKGQNDMNKTISSVEGHHPKLVGMSYGEKFMSMFEHEYEDFEMDRLSRSALVKIATACAPPLVILDLMRDKSKSCIKNMLPWIF